LPPGSMPATKHPFLHAPPAHFTTFTHAGCAVLPFWTLPLSCYVLVDSAAARACERSTGKTTRRARTFTAPILFCAQHYSTCSRPSRAMRTALRRTGTSSRAVNTLRACPAPHYLVPAVGVQKLCHCSTLRNHIHYATVGCAHHTTPHHTHYPGFHTLPHHTPGSSHTRTPGEEFVHCTPI